MHVRLLRKDFGQTFLRCGANILSNRNQLLEENIWYNSNFVIDDKSITNIAALRSDISLVNDLIQEDGKFLGFESVQIWCSNTVNFMQYYGIVCII